MEWSITSDEVNRMQQHCIEGFPLESCGLFLGSLDSKGVPSGEIKQIWPATNSAQSARVYEVDPKDMFEATKYAGKNDLEIVGVYHSHTHTKAYPSPTDIKQAVDPNWCYAIVSLAHKVIQTNYFTIDSENISELKMRIL